jgi:hypothetical protein
MPYENAHRDNNRRQSQVALSVHDQQVSECRRLRCTVGNHTNRANGKKALLMLPSGALKTESDIMDHWTKDK